MATVKRALLVVAADAREFRGILRNCESTNDLGLPIAFSKQARMGMYQLTCVADGPGPGLAFRAISAVQEKERFDAVVSTGFCGALDASLQTGSIVVATGVLDLEHERQYESCTVSTGKPFASGLVVSQDRVAGNAVEKSSLRTLTGAVAVEMEASAVARFATESHLPFYCVRVVSDTANEDFCIDLNQARGPNGRFRSSRIVAAALRSPIQRIPALAKLDRNCRAAETSLGEFFANCSFT